jgi:hypothetical protein
MAPIFSMAVICCVTLFCTTAHAVHRTHPVDEQQALKTRATVRAIFNAAQSYYYDKGEWPKTVGELFGEHYGKRSRASEAAPVYRYLDIALADTLEWNYQLQYDGPPSKIRARAKSIYVEFEGDTVPAQVDYDVLHGEWSGYGVPWYSHDTLTNMQEVDLADQVKTSLPIIWEAARTYYYDKGLWPESVAVLEREHYTYFLSTSLFLQWQFNFVGSPPRFIVATSTYFMPDGVGKIVEYSGDSLSWHGYGCPTK